jgi:Fe2+ or Zn2+ uptake regulation protein
LVCLGCGEVIEFDSPLIARAAAGMRKEKGFDITSLKLRIEGYCPRCREKQK